MILVREYLKHLTHRVFQSFGYDFCHYTSDSFVSLRRMEVLASQGVTLVLDVGADEGTYPQILRQSGYRGRILSFEPLPDSFRVLSERAARDPLWKCQNVAVGSRDGTTQMNISGHTTSSSILPMGPAHLSAMPSSATLRKETVTIVRLDSLLDARFDRDERIYLKADVQGYEKHVLEGAGRVMGQIRAIELELSLAPLYEEGPGLIEMIEYLENSDYVMTSLEAVFRDPHTGRLLQVDGIFVRR